MRRLGFQLLGFAVWKAARTYLRQRYGGAPKKLAAGVLVAVVLVAVLRAQRRTADGD